MRFDVTDAKRKAATLLAAPDQSLVWGPDHDVGGAAAVELVNVVEKITVAAPRGSRVRTATGSGGAHPEDAHSPDHAPTGAGRALLEHLALVAASGETVDGIPLLPTERRRQRLARDHRAAKLNSRHLTGAAAWS